MPTLNWIGKDKVLNHHLEVPFHVLERQYSFDEAGKHEEDNGSENMIIHGDNLLALKSLLPKYEGKIKCIYIDPPYNTGNENWVYNDNVNDPQMQHWLHQVVGKEGEDLSRHDKWLCMMYPRLKLLQRLLAEDGVIFISIDDNEQAKLRLICDEIFGNGNFLATIVWKSRAKPSNTGDAKYKPQNDAEYIFLYGNGNTKQFLQVNSGKNRSYPHSDFDGEYRLQTILKSNRGESRRDTMCFEINGYKPPETKRWQAGKDTIEELFNNNRITFESGEPMLKYYKHEENNELSPFYCHIPKEASGTAESGKKLLNAILGNQHNFDTVKPLEIVKYILNRCLSKESIVLDSFAGSGTTAHAVLDMNKADGGNRKFICIEMMDYADTITAERVKRVINGYKAEEDKEELLYDEELKPSNLNNAPQMLADAKAAKKAAKESGAYDSVGNPKIVDNHLQVIGKIKATEEIVGTGGSFSYYELGEPLLVDDKLNNAVSTEKIREYIYYMETKQALPEASADEPMLLGVYHGAAYYFNYEKDASTTLNAAFLKSIKTQAEAYVIYADTCVLSENKLQQFHITFKKIPRDIARL